jgi:hypothetical protein
VAPLPSPLTTPHIHRGPPPPRTAATAGRRARPPAAAAPPSPARDQSATGNPIAGRQARPASWTRSATCTRLLRSSLVSIRETWALTVATDM